jgi:hypothetical protein
MPPKIHDDKRRQIEALLPTGLPQPEIAKRVGVAAGTVNNVAKALRGGSTSTVKRPRRAKATAPAAPASAPAPPAPAPAKVDELDPTEVPDEVPEATGLAEAHRWLAIVNRARERAEADKNWGAVASLAAKATALLEHIRKATPVAKADPNENPDMIKARELARATFHKLIKFHLDKKEKERL